MRIKERILFLFVMLAAASPLLCAAHVCDTIVSNGLCYTMLDGDSTMCLVSPVEDYGSDCVIVPTEIAGYHVTAIGDSAFARCRWLNALSLPATLTAIGTDAFVGCDALTTVFSHVPKASVVTPHVPDGSMLAVDDEYIDSYSQFSGTIKTLINVDDVPHSANLCDLNHDGVVTAADVTRVYDNLLGYSTLNGDANGDGSVTSADVTAVYDALLAGNTCGVGDKGYCFVTLNKNDGSLMMRVGESLRLEVGDEVRVVAHDNEQTVMVTSGVGMMKGLLPSGGMIDLEGIPTIVLGNKHYNTGATAPVVMYVDKGDTIYYKDVQVNVVRHVVTDTLRVLSIGNSFSLDALSYVPFLMKAVAPQVYLKLGVMYIGGGSLENFYNALDTNVFRYYWSYGAQPWDERLDVALTDVVASESWDVITFQQQSNLSRDYSTYQPYLNGIIEWFDEKVSWQHEYAWLVTPSYPDNLPRLAPDTTSVQMFERILQCVSNVQQDTGIELLMPCGTAIQNARTTPLDALGDQGHLFDYLHLQEGIPCLIEAYVATAVLLARYGLSDNVWTDTTWIDRQWLRAKNIQEINGEPVGMSEENRIIAKQCAIKALENPLTITIIE